VHKCGFLNFSVDKGKTVESCPQFISVNLSLKKLAGQGVLEKARGVVNMCTGHNTKTNNFFKEEKERGKNEIHMR
jgi:hypothetical protein